MKHWKTTFTGLLTSAALLAMGLMLCRDLMGLPKSVIAAKVMLAFVIVAAIANILNAWHTADKHHVDRLHRKVHGENRE